MTDSTSAWQKMRKEVPPSPLALPFPSVISSFIVPPPHPPPPVGPLHSPHILIPTAHCPQGAPHSPALIRSLSESFPHPAFPPTPPSSTVPQLIHPPTSPAANQQCFPIKLHIHPSLINPVVNNLELFSVLKI
jgi:hypothetical protein